MSVDVWGVDLEVDEPASIEAWNSAWKQAMHFVGDAFGTLAPVNVADEAFSMGSIFCGVYRVLGGSRFDAPELLADIDRVRTRATSSRERSHLAALELLTAGNFTAAARAWDRIAEGTLDFAAVRFSHDIYLHIGDAARRLRSSQAAMDTWRPDDPFWSLVAGQHAFSLEEAGFLAEAEELGHRALDADPMDLWALHALAHVYETTGDSETAIDLLRARQGTWSAQDQLSVHIWWHLALRLMAQRQFDEVLHIHDSLVPEATTPFRLCDLASILWRLELEGVDVGSRWEPLAVAFADRPERHTSGFLDLHAAMVFTRQPEHPAASVFFAGVDSEHASGGAENDDTFRTVVAPLVEGIRVSSIDPGAAVSMLDQVDADLHRIGGSIAQRDIVKLTKQSLHQESPEETVREDT